MPKSLKNELVASTLVGPLRYLVPIVSYAALYPLILRRYGLELLGLWSLLATIISYITLADAGFSSLFTREMTAGDGAELAGKHGAEYKAARLFYLGMMIGLIITLAASFPFWRNHASHLPGIHHPSLFALDIACLMAAGSITLASKMESAILLAQGRIIYTQLVSTITPVLLLVTNTAGALCGYPIESFAFGALMSSALEYWLYRHHLRQTLPDFFTTCQDIPAGISTLRHLKPLLKRGKYLYLTQIGGNLRDPLFRFILAGTLGLSAIAIFDVAFRLTRTVMDMATGGIVKALFPVLSRLIRERQEKKTADLLHISFLILLVIAACGQGGVIILGEPFYALWLGSVPQHLMASTLVFTGWIFIATIFIPFSSFLNASHNERTLAIGTWTHIIISLLIIPVLMLDNISITSAIAIWSVAGCITIALRIQYLVHKAPEVIKWLWRPECLLLSMAGVLFLVLMGILASNTMSTLGRLLVWAISSSVYTLMALGSLIAGGLMPKVRWPRNVAHK